MVIDQEFNPSVEMMVNDFDDERTLDEEEALEVTEDPATELSNLQREGDMPLEELLAMYGYGEQCAGGGEGPSSNSSSEEGGTGLRELYTSPQQAVAPREEEDGDYSPPDDEDWRKTIMVGADYQAGIPEGLCRYGDALPYENEDKLLWEPGKLGEREVEEFLVRAQEPLVNNNSVGAIPTGSHTRDDEQALYLLLQCGYNVEEALRRRRMNVIPPTDTMSLWSEEECRNFENGLRSYGKDFHLIQQNKVSGKNAIFYQIKFNIIYYYIALIHIISL